MTKDIGEILGIMQDKKVFIFGTSPQISDLFLTPYGLEIISDTSVKHKNRKGSCVLENVVINLPEDKRQKLRDIFNGKFNSNDIITMGVNYFSCYFPVDIAFWGDIASKAMTREILNKSEAWFKCSLDNVTNIYKEEINYDALTHTFKWLGSHSDKIDFRTCDLPTEYSGYLWWWRTGVLGAIHMAAMAGASHIIVSGVEWNPCSADHFYEDSNKDNVFGWVDAETITQTEKFLTTFPDIKFIKTSETSYLPFEFMELDDCLNE